MDITTQRFLRLALAVVFLYAPIAAFVNPDSWIGYVPGFVRGFPVDTVVILHTIGLGQIGIAVWLLIGRKLFIPSVLATLFLVSIVVVNIAQIDVVFRDVGLAIVAAALAVDALRSSSEATRRESVE